MDTFRGYSFGDFYGPAAGQAVAERASMSPNGLTRRPLQALNVPLGLPALIALGIAAWWLIKTTD